MTAARASQTPTLNRSNPNAVPSRQFARFGALQANAFFYRRAVFGKRLHVSELEKSARMTAPAICGDEGPLPALKNVRRATHSDRQVESLRLALPVRHVTGF